MEWSDFAKDSSGEFTKSDQIAQDSSSKQVNGKESASDVLQSTTDKSTSADS